jgi:hypothetical protein
MASRRPQTGSPAASEVSDSFAAYKEYNSALLTWFLTFGGGCLAALVSDKYLRTTVHRNEDLRLVAALLNLYRCSCSAMQCRVYLIGSLPA